ncbi:hypothetical protein AGABI2DRAFT_200955 [Agaricus bisporus var. bisporus H97]|uniref:hypothetical protein n=1 Tax=Agaricus bisporus var. bisporus (strain H97 / ATCC MYA-4626 / FGSC 10389) TaxID=936046 RepID=UPI00029F791C|nr:hypothetical protein AGABI2DRAFT_200955 [Agaricus bisporus var. bisporus H97]EKV48943.1 hypothetical protein AGABI2DRAFT_200955 [Agaricus bisporus var. bisporus H97]
MATYVGKAASKHFAKRFAPPDPYYETYSDEKGKHKQRKRALPPGLSKRDAAILRSVRKRAHRQDEGIRICGLTFGWTFVIGIIPVVGDVANLTLNHVLVIKKAKKADIPPSLLRSMEVHNVISTGMGMIPVIGDISVAIYKPNTRNAAMLEEFLRIRGEEALRLNPEGDERSGNGALRWRRGSSWFRRNKKKSDQENSASASGMNTPPGTGPSNLKVDGRSASRISSTSITHQEHGISSTASENSSIRGNGRKDVGQGTRSRKGRFFEH